MKKPFFFRSSKKQTPPPAVSPPELPSPAADDIAETAPDPAAAPDTTTPDAAAVNDGFREWARSATRGGIERRERNDIFEEYCVYGADADGRLTCRRWHRYPEHERDFSLSYSRSLTFDEFNRRLLGELDRGGLRLCDYGDCIVKAEQLSGMNTSAVRTSNTEFDDAELAAVRDYCEAIDTLKDKDYYSGSGVFRCEGTTVAGGEELIFRKPLTHDALDIDIPGVSRTPIEGYDIESLWIMSAYNRLRERCTRCRVIKLTSDWDCSREPIFLFAAEGVVSGTLLTAVAGPEALSRFGFYSLDFIKR